MPFLRTGRVAIDVKLNEVKKVAFFNVFALEYEPIDTGRIQNRLNLTGIFSYMLSAAVREYKRGIRSDSEGNNLCHFWLILSVC